MKIDKQTLSAVKADLEKLAQSSAVAGLALDPNEFDARRIGPNDVDQFSWADVFYQAERKAAGGALPEIYHVGIGGSDVFAIETASGGKGHLGLFTPKGQELALAEVDGHKVTWTTPDGRGLVDAYHLHDLERSPDVKGKLVQDVRELLSPGAVETLRANGWRTMTPDSGASQQLFLGTADVNGQIARFYPNGDVELESDRLWLAPDVVRSDKDGNVIERTAGHFAE